MQSPSAALPHPVRATSAARKLGESDPPRRLSVTG